MNGRDQRLRIACRIFAGVSYLFWIIGLIVVFLSITGIADHTWQGSLFLVIGTIALLNTKLGMYSSHKWAWLALAVLFIPWTLIGLVDDMRLGYWPLVVGEIFGLVVITVALVLAFPSVFFKNIQEKG